MDSGFEKKFSRPKNPAESLTIDLRKDIDYKVFDKPEEAAAHTDAANESIRAKAEPERKSIVEAAELEQQTIDHARALLDSFVASAGGLALLADAAKLADAFEKNMQMPQTRFVPMVERIRLRRAKEAMDALGRMRRSVRAQIAPLMNETAERTETLLKDYPPDKAESTHDIFRDMGANIYIAIDAYIDDLFRNAGVLPQESMRQRLRKTQESRS